MRNVKYLGVLASCIMSAPTLSAHTLDDFEISNVTYTGSKVVNLHVDNTDHGVWIVCAVYDENQKLITSTTSRTENLATKVSIVVPDVAEVKFYRCVKA